MHQIQIANLKSDEAKNLLAYEAGYQLYRVWASDFFHNYQKVKADFKTFYENYEISKLTLLKIPNYSKKDT